MAEKNKISENNRSFTILNHKDNPILKGGASRLKFANNHKNNFQKVKGMKTDFN